MNQEDNIELYMLVPSVLNRSQTHRVDTQMFISSFPTKEAAIAEMSRLIATFDYYRNRTWQIEQNVEGKIKKFQIIL